MAGPAGQSGLHVSTLFDDAMGLKHVTRAGWVRAGIPSPESVAGHSWGMAWLVMVLAPPNINRLRAMELAIVHDLAEARVGDITPHDGVSRAEKKRLETEAIDSMLADRPDLLEIWREYDDSTSPEAKFVHDIDRLDMALQAHHYGNSHDADTHEFMDSAIQSIHNPFVADLIEGLRQK